MSKKKRIAYLEEKLDEMALQFDFVDKRSWIYNSLTYVPMKLRVAHLEAAIEDISLFVGSLMDELGLDSKLQPETRVPKKVVITKKVKK